MRIAWITFGLALAASTAAPAAAQQAAAPQPDVAWGPAPAGRPPFMRMLLPNHLSIDVPGREGRDWYARVGSGNVLVVAIERKKGEAGLWIEAVPIASATTDVEDSYLVAAAADDLKAREPSASEARHAVVTREGHRFVYSTFLRKGVLPFPERVLQYFFLTPGLSYRLACASDASVAERYTAICGHMARSFAMTLPAAAPSARSSPQ